MFQVPVNNLERIRRARKKVKGILLELGLESCRDLLQEINSCGPGEKCFSNTSWADLSLWESTGKRKRYRTKPFCCSLCNFSAKLPSSLKSHLHRNHEEELDQELVVPCPSCAFSSQSKTVVKHMRMFHTSVRKINSAAVNNNNNGGGAGQTHFKKDIQFSCLKCSFTDTLYYSIKKHVLVTHFDNIVGAYFGEMPPSVSEMPEYAALSSEQKSQLPNKYYCKKCHTPATSADALIYHILTSEKHRDLEYELRSLISEFSRAPAKRTVFSKHAGLPSKSQPIQFSASASVPVPNPASVQLVSFSQHNRNPLMMGQLAAPLQNSVGPMPVVSNCQVGMMHTSPSSVMPQSRLGYLPNSIPVSQNMSLPSSLSQPMFVSQGFHMNQSIGPGVHPGTHAISSGVLPPNPFVRPGMFPQYQSVRSSVLPPSQALHPGGHPLNQSSSGGFSLNHSVPPGLYGVNQSVRPGYFPPNQNVRPPAIPGAQSNSPGVFQTNQYVAPGVSQNNFMATGGPLMRQLIPTGKQVNGIPTYTLGPVPVTMAGSPSGVSSSNPQVPVQLSQSGAVVQVSRSPASAPSLPVVASPQSIIDQTLRLPPIPSAEEKNTKQWKTCPVCSELFPSNVYQVHMQVAHKLQGGADREEKDKVDQEKLAARAPFLRWVKEKIVRCLSCKCFMSEEGLVKHLLMHGIVCLFCTWTFHDLKGFVEHNAIVHSGNKKMPLDYIQKGFQLANDANGEILFPHFDFNTKMPKDQIGGKEVHLAVLAGANHKAVMPVYIKVQPLPADIGDTCVKQAFKCPFCLCVFAGLQVYETHLKERHHIVPTLHTILGTPAFKCIHCCGVYTGNMTLAAISVHLMRCRSAPKTNNSRVDLTSQSNGDIIPSMNGEKNSFLTKRKSFDSLSMLTKEDQKDKEEVSVQILSKRSRLEDIMQNVEIPIDDKDGPRRLAMDPDEYEIDSKGDVKLFLSEYFNKRPYPTKKEMGILSSLLCEWKIDVPAFFLAKQQVCLKAIERQQTCVVLGFNMSELKKLKHNLSIGQE